ncbi:MAG TPA: hypothetical protein VKV06_07700, partial [Acidimicrobiales bacterium]|nr:hypothetical protein [Acidimicrobiales bacterium]
MVSDLGGWAGFGQKPEPEPPARRLRRVDDTAAPADVVDHREALDFPLDGVWPDETVRFIRQVAVSTSTDPAMVATLALPVLGAAIGNSRAIRPKRDWEERARFWTVVIA